MQGQRVLRNHLSNFSSDWFSSQSKKAGTDKRMDRQTWWVHIWFYLQICKYSKAYNKNSFTVCNLPDICKRQFAMFNIRNPLETRYTTSSLLTSSEEQYLVEDRDRICECEKISNIYNQGEGTEFCGIKLKQSCPEVTRNQSFKFDSWFSGWRRGICGRMDERAKRRDESMMGFLFAYMEIYQIS